MVRPVASVSGLDRIVRREAPQPVIATPSYARAGAHGPAVVYREVRPAPAPAAYYRIPGRPTVIREFGFGR